MPSNRRAPYDRVLERRRAVALAQHYRYAEGLSIAQIADRLGRSPATIKAYFYDPTGDKARAVKARYVGLCRGCGAYTHGRRSYEFFGARWRPRSGQLADRLNSMPKYVVSSTLEDPEWNNSTILKGDVVTEVSKLKQELDGEIVVPGSYQLGRKLIEHDLVDELRLVVFPVLLGAGERLFGETNHPMRLVDITTIGDGLVYLSYELVHGA